MKRGWSRRSLKMAAAVFLFGAFATTLHATTPMERFQACLKGVVDSRQTAFVAFQSALHDLLIRDNPEFAEVAAVNRDMQVTLNALRSIRLSFMIETDPERFRDLDGLSAFMNLHMDEAAERTLESRNADYRDLLAERARHKERTSAQTNWDAVRSRFRAMTAEDPDYAAAVEQHQTAYGAAEERLSDCRKLDPTER
ncbi:MAG: hypothetical protein AAGL24_19730 [Pseudomonadota bacterium]